MRRTRSMPGNRLSTSCHLQQPVSPLRSVWKRNQPANFFEENPPNKKSRESMKPLNCGTSESPDNCSESDSEGSVYEDCESVASEPGAGTGSYHSSGTSSSDSDESDLILSENTVDDKAWTDIERELMAKVGDLQTAYDNLLLQVSRADLTSNSPVHAHVMNLQRQRDEYLKEARKSRVIEDQLLHRMTELLSRITQLESERDKLEEDGDSLKLRNSNLLASNNTLQDNLKVIMGRLAIVAADLRNTL